MPVRIHFPSPRENVSAIALAHACGVGKLEHRQKVDVHRFDKLFSQGAKFFQAVGLDDAQVMVFPHHYWPGEESARAMDAAAKRRIPAVFFKDADDPTPIQLSYGVIYRDSIIADQRTASERALAAFSDDFLADRGGQVVTREKQPIPRVGFCGYVGTALYRTVYLLTGRRQKVQGLYLRQRALRSLKKNPAVKCDFIARSQFWGGALSRFHLDAEKQIAVRQEYLQNVFDNDYTLCLRGAGNFSYRFYEVLSAGRIPLFINTKCVLPFADKIDWRRHCAWVEEHDLGRAGEILLDFHSKLSAADFVQMQQDNRKLWEEWLEPLSFYRRVLEQELPA